MPSLRLQRGDLRTGLHAELGVEVRQRLVHEEDLRLADDRPAHRDPLALATGERLRLAAEVLLQLEQLRRLLDPPVDLGLRGLAQLQRERHVLVHRHVRVEGVVLEDHRDVAGLRREVGDVPLVDVDRAVVDILQAGEHPQAGGLAATGGADQDEELPVADLQVELVDRGALGARVDPGRLRVRDRSHGEALPFTGRNVPDDPSEGAAGAHGAGPRTAHRATAVADPGVIRVTAR